MTSISSSDFATDLGTVQRKPLRNFARTTETEFCQKEENRLKINEDVEIPQLQGPMKS